MTIGFAVCGSFCTFSKVLPQIEKIKDAGHSILPIMSEIAYHTDTRFGTAASFIEKIEAISGKPVIHDVPGAEPIGPKKLCDILVIAPCTGNTLGKMAGGITDTSVTMAAKSHLRNRRPVLIAVSTNDALGAAAKNIGHLMNCKNLYFVPMKQDDPFNKTMSMVADMDKILSAIEAAREGVQLQPVII